MQTKRKVVHRCSKLIRIALNRKKDGRLRHFLMTRNDFRLKCLRPSSAWSVMTSLFATEHDSERGRTRVMLVASLDYATYFSDYERNLLIRLSEIMRARCGSQNRQVLIEYLKSQRNTLQEFTLCEKLVKELDPSFSRQV